MEREREDVGGLLLGELTSVLQAQRRYKPPARPAVVVPIER